MKTMKIVLVAIAAFAILMAMPVSASENIGSFHSVVKPTIGIYRVANATNGHLISWYFDTNHDGTWSGSNHDTMELLGSTGDIPCPADYNNDGITEMAIFRPGTSMNDPNRGFYIDMKHKGMWDSDGVHYLFGQPGDIPVVGDYNGDGITDLAVFRPGTDSYRGFYIEEKNLGAWNASSPYHIHYTFGTSGDQPFLVSLPTTAPS